MKEKRKVPVRDTIKLLWAMDRKFPVIVILQGGLNALLFYLPVLLVARILDLLVYRENSADPVSIAVVGLVGIWLLKGVKALLEKEMKTRSYQIAMRFETLVPVHRRSRPPAFRNAQVQKSIFSAAVPGFSDTRLFSRKQPLTTDTGAYLYRIFHSAQPR